MSKSMWKKFKNFWKKVGEIIGEIIIHLG